MPCLGMSFTDTITGEMLLLPGVEKADHGEDDFELRVGGKPFAHIHGPDRIEVRLPPDIKESLIFQGAVSRSPEMHDREGWVIMRLGERPNLKFAMRIIQTGYHYVSSTL